MATRWGRGMLLGALAACGLPTMALAQQPPVGDPVPLASGGMQQPGSAFPGAQGGVMPTGYTGGPAMGGMGPGMVGGPPGMGGMPGGMLPTMQAPGGFGIGTDAPLGRKDYPFTLSASSLFHIFDWESDGASLWFSFGWKALQRGQSQNHLLAAFDPNGFDAGLAPLSNLPTAVNFKDTPTDMNHGLQGAIGFYYDEMLWEISGWGLAEHDAGTRIFVNPGRLTSYFFNIPTGFEGTNAGLWQNADIMTLRMQSSFYNVELNSHMMSGDNNCTYDFMIGARYMNVTEKLSFFTSDDAVQIGSVPFTDALMSHRAQNNLMGLHIGFTQSYQPIQVFGMSWENRGGVYANLMDVNHYLQRGDGLLGFDRSVQKWDVAASYETGAFIHVNTPRIRVRAGYEFKWLFNVASAENQFDFDLQGVVNKLDSNGIIFYHGPTATVDLIW